MIFYWLISILRKFIRLWHIPKPEDLAKIDPNARCPVCGAREGRLRCVWQAEPGPQSKDVPPKYKVQCQHTCDECGARWFEKPVINVDPTKVLSSVARNEHETKEDRTAMLQPGTSD